jgi:putative intracellular protease/amidase
VSATVDVLGDPKRVLMLVSNPAVSERTGWPIGFWWAELTHPYREHPYREFVEAGYDVTIASPDGGALEADGFSDPEHPSGFSADDLLSLGFAKSPAHAALVAKAPALADLDTGSFDALFLVGGQGPMYTFRRDQRVKDLVGAFAASGRVTALVCHATCVLLDARTPAGELVVAGRTWTGFADSEEDLSDAMAGQRIQPFRIEEEARAVAGTNFIVQGPFRAHAVRDGNLVTGQQQYSGAATARLVIDALGR